MKAYMVSKDSDLTIEEKEKRIEDYSAGDLLYVVREYENVPRRFEEEVIKAVGTKLYHKGACKKLCVN